MADNGVGFAGGLMSGLTEAVDAGRARKAAQEARRTQHARDAITMLVNSGQVSDVSDLDPLLQVAYPDVYGEQAKKKAKNGAPGPHDIANAFLSHAMDQDRATRGSPAAGAPAGASPEFGKYAMTAQPGAVAPPDQSDANAMLGIPSAQPATDQQSAAEMFGLPQTPPPTVETPQAGPPQPQAGAPPPTATPPQVPAQAGAAPGPRRTLMGVPLMSVEEAQQRGITREVNLQQGKLTGQIDLARRMYPLLKQVDPSITLPMVLQEITGHRMASTAAMGMKPIAGTVDGKAVSAVFSPTAGYLDANTMQPLRDFLPSRMGGAGAAPHFTGAAAQAVQRQLIANNLPPDFDLSSDIGKQVVAAASKDLEATAATNQAAKQGMVELRDWQLGKTPTTPSSAASPAAATPTAPGNAEPTGTPAAASAQPTEEPVTKPTPKAAPGDYPTGRQYHGPTYDTLQPAMQSEAEQIAFYKRQPPAGRMAMTPHMAKVMQAAQEINPTFNAMNYANIQQGLKAFTTGEQGKNMTSLNTALGHLLSFTQSAEKLSNEDIKLWNRVSNKAAEEIGDPRLAAIQVDKTALASELTRLFRGTGGAEKDVEEWAKTLDRANSPAQFGAAVRELNKLISSRQNALKTQWETIKGAPSWDDMGFVAPETRQAVAKSDVIARRMLGMKAPTTATPATKPEAGAAPAKPAAKGANAIVPGIVSKNGHLYRDGVQID